ncbi:hypothetical protein Daesc_007900 [Daldinia eschscholtzii]|uniref:Uncharacterized protein n=1 Tax=Daldinia eschscholtzii TaxID=292717 RepID=A0AAX6MFY9_9PEZI
MGQASTSVEFLFQVRPAIWRTKAVLKRTIRTAAFFNAHLCTRLWSSSRVLAVHDHDSPSLSTPSFLNAIAGFDSGSAMRPGMAPHVRMVRTEEDAGSSTLRRSSSQNDNSVKPCRALDN